MIYNYNLHYGQYQSLASNFKFELIEKVFVPSFSLLEKVQTDDPVWREAGEAFITSVTRLLERLLDYRSVMQGEGNRDKRMSCIFNLLNFYKNEINRKEMYLR